MESGKIAIAMTSPEIASLFETLGFSVYATHEYSPHDLYNRLKTDDHNVGLICISEAVDIDEGLQSKLYSLDIPLIFFPEEEGTGANTLEALVERAVGMKPDFLKE